MDLRCAKCLEGWRHLLEERDRRYDDRFEAQKSAVELAFRSQRELNTVVAEASARAINKAEDAQREYNVRSNEFRGALDDQSKQIALTMLTRHEADSRFESVMARIDGLQAKYDEKFETLRRDGRTQTNWSTGVLVAIALSAGSALLTLLRDRIP